MRKIFTSLLLIILCTQSAVFAQKAQMPPQFGKDDLKKVIAAMSLEEKALLLVGMGMRADIPGIPQPSAEDLAIPEKVPGAAGRTHAIKRLGIPSITLSDGPAGVRIDPKRKGSEGTYYATAFPVATLLASSWDTQLVSEIGTAFGDELKDFGIDVLLAPGMNIQRNPLGGRNFEYYSEDPVVAGMMAAAFVDGVESKGIGTSIKHFAANSQEFNRMKSDSVVSERALREIYLRGFEIAVKKSQPWTVMSSYNLINGIYASQNHDLLTGILRDEWGFEGFVMTDWFAGDDAAAQVAAGNEVIMPGLPPQKDAIVKAVEDGRLSGEVLDRAVERVLRIILRSPTFKGVPSDSKPDLEGHAKLARRAGAEGMVLLKNEKNALPMTAGKKVALFGNAAYETITGGTGSGDVNEAYTVSVYQGLSEAGHAVDQYRKNEYEKYIASEKSKQPPTLPFFPKPPIPEMVVTSSVAREAAADSDLGVFVLGRNSGEFADREVEDDFDISANERTSIEALSDAFRSAGKKFIVVLNIGGAIETASWRDSADAILLSWQPGQEGGHSIADVLAGKVNPSGRLAVSFPAKYSDVPSSKTFPGRLLSGGSDDAEAKIFSRPAEAIYDEGIFVGYRYYTTFGVRPAYEFGYGLSYTTFELSGFSLRGNGDKGEADVRVKVTNTGNVAGRDVVQVYVGGHGGTKRELKAFAKTKLLKPGEGQEFRFQLTAADLASFYTKESAWIATKGAYEISAGGTSSGGGLGGSFDLKRDVVVERTAKLLVPKKEFTELALPIREAPQE